MKKSLLLLLILCIGTALACRLAPSATPTAPAGETLPAATVSPTSPPEPVIIPTGVAQEVDWPAGEEFAPYEAPQLRLKPQVTEYAPDLEALANPEKLAQFGLNDAQQAALQQVGFVVVPQEVEPRTAQLYEIYQRADQSETPAFVTTDVVLHAFHVLYDRALRQIEAGALLGDLQALTATMVDAATVQAAATENTVQAAAVDNQAFFGVAAALLDPAYQPPAAVATLVRDESTLIEAADGIYISPLMGVEEDYSQYRPRGHYILSEDLQRYFRAMMWLGRLGFRVETPVDPTLARHELRQALLMLVGLQEARVGDESALATWERIYEPTTFFVTEADDLTVYDLEAAARVVYGGLLAPADLADETLLSNLQATLATYPAPSILSAPLSDVELAAQGGPPRQFRFFGQRLVPDSAVLQQLVYSNVGLYQGEVEDTPFTLVHSDVGAIRGMPRGLDVAAALNSERALNLLEAAGDTAYDGYAEQLAALQTEFDALPTEQWTATLYWQWLYSIQPLLEPAGDGMPFFMQSDAWTDRQLSAWLNSWTELRHDTVLYAKQSYTAQATGAEAEPRPVHGYVEPQPLVYARLAVLAAQMRSGLAQRGLLDEEMRGKLIGLEDLLLTLQSVAEKELRNQTPSDVEYLFIRGIGDRLEALTTFATEDSTGLEAESDVRMALVTDVHTDPNSGQVLQEAVGDAFPIYVIVPVEGQQVLALGGVMSYYEFKQPLSQRLTDEEWQAMATRPERPVWTASFVVP